jgi:hypothetical protein
MTLRLLLAAAAASTLLSGLPAGARQPAAEPDPKARESAPAEESAETGAEAARQAEQAADEAVAEAREEAAQARTDAGADGATRPVTISDVRTGSRVHDTQGGVVGTIESVDDTGGVVSSGRARAKLPFSSFGRNDRGLVISLTRAELEAEVEARTPS